MYKTIGLYKQMENPEEFIDFYEQVITPRLLCLPGVVKVEMTRLMASPFRESQDESAYFLMVETSFESPEALQQVLQSPEGMETVRLLVERAGESMTAFVGKSTEWISD
ncbi:EthD family reductase [Staphylospora marina]|uniref:EthD family reductase n=1 Tax=Staphylospora marina TaxID=2490858 RepID=UPI000F5B9F14|nr:EthD family reductase [Staphylospora marina]